jgi:hypothetical protein
VALWAAASALLYRRVRRLLPFVVVHALWDIQAAAHDFVSDQVQLWLFAVVFFGLWLVSGLASARSKPQPEATTST